MSAMAFLIESILNFPVRVLLDSKEFYPTLTSFYYLNRIILEKINQQ